VAGAVLDAARLTFGEALAVLSRRGGTGGPRLTQLSNIFERIVSAFDHDGSGRGAGMPVTSTQGRSILDSEVHCSSRDTESGYRSGPLLESLAITESASTST